MGFRHERIERIESNESNRTNRTNRIESNESNRTHRIERIESNESNQPLLLIERIDSWVCRANHANHESNRPSDSPDLQVRILRISAHRTNRANQNARFAHS